MALEQPLVHCLLDVEPASFHLSDIGKPIAFAVNLSLECPSDSGSATPVGDEEIEARLVFDKFLQAVQKVQFHVWKFVVGTGFEWVGKVEDQVSEISLGPASDLLTWLDGETTTASAFPARYWSTGSIAKAGVEAEIIVEAAGAADRLRAAQAWNAPIAHKFALTHVLRPETKSLDDYVVLPYFADPGASPDKPTTANTVADDTWDASYDPLAGFGKITCRTNLLKKSTLPLDLPGEVDPILTREGFLKVDPDAANLRRVARWFEDRAAALLAPGSALASHPDQASKRYEPLFEPTFTQDAENKVVIAAPVAAWAAAAGLCATLDNLVIGILKPASGDETEGQILAPFVSALLAELDAPAIRETHKLNPEHLRAPIVTGALRDSIRHSPLGQRTSDRAELAKALRHVHGIAKPGPDAAVGARYLEALLRFYDGNSELIVDPTLPAAVQGQGLAMLIQALTDAEQRLQDEAGAEAAVLRLIETSAPAFNGPPAKSIAEKYAVAIGRSDDDALKTAIEQHAVPLAWAGFRAVLDRAFNGAEAVRRAAGSEFLKVVLAQVSGTTRKSSEQFRTLVKDADYFVARLFGDDTSTPQLGCFGPLIRAVPTPEFLGKPDDEKLIREHLTPGYTASVEGLDPLFDSTARFIPDNAPHPLSIQIAANIDGAQVDNFARHLNGIAVGLRRIDSADDGKNRWAHANLADLTWARNPKTLEKDKTVEGAIHPMLPAVSDGRAPMFIEYEGFPFASTELLSTRLPDSDATGTRCYKPFYRHSSSQTSRFAPVPRLAYGRAFQSFAFVTTNAGTLPLELQDTGNRPWMPQEKLEPPTEAAKGELIATAEYSRRTPISQSAVEEVRNVTNPLRIGAPIAGVAPLASDYPRIGLFAEGATRGTRDLFRGSDGYGALVIGSVTATTSTSSWRLADVRWTGTPKLIAMRFFDGPAAGPDQAGVADFVFEQADPNNVGNLNSLDLEQVGAISITAKTTRTDAANPIGPLDVELEVSCAGFTLARSFQTRFDTLWLRLVLQAEGPSAGMTFADVGVHKPDGVDAPLLLLAPDKAWSSGLSGGVTARVHTPRVGFLDFDRWLGNGDLRKRVFNNDDDAARRLEEALLAAYVMRHLDAELAAALDRLPDPSVEQLRLELIVLDQLTGTPVTPTSATFDVSPLLRAIAKRLNDNIDWTPELLKSKIFREIEKQFCCTIEVGPGSSATLAGTGSAFSATVPAGHVARLSIDALVPAEHFEKQGLHPPVIDCGLLQYATRSIEGDRVAFPSAALRIETMLGFTNEQKQAAVPLAADMIVAEPVERSRRYDIVTRDRLPAGADHADRTRFWRLISEIDVTSQRWRPSGRPIYHHVAPRAYRADGETKDARVRPALQLQLDKEDRLAQFEDEAFFDRSSLDAQTITQKLLPLPSRTVLQQHMWDAPSATYFRHRFTLRSRYAGALRADRELNAWAADAEKPVTAWTMRVAMLADLSRILLTRPQLRALIPLTTAPGADTAKRPAPPVLGVLQEPPFARGGLADRIDAEIKTGFGYGFEADDKPVEIRELRREIGPTPYLDYRPLNETVALGMTLMSEGPIGLTFDQVDASAPAFPNSLITLSPIGVGDVALNRGPLEEHILGVSLRRHIDPEWTSEQIDERRSGIDAERCWWIEVELQRGMKDKVLQYSAAGAEADLLAIGEAIDAFIVRTFKLAVDGSVAGAKKLDVDVARLRDNFSAKLCILHQPVAPGRYSLSVFAIPRSDWVDTVGGHSNSPLMLASFEWSPPKDEKGKKEKPVVVTLTAHENATVRAAMASASTFLAWTRTSRDFDFVQVAEEKQPRDPADPKVLASEPARITQLVAMLTSDHEKILLKRSGSSGNAAWLTSSTFLSEYPLHVHRHLAVLTTRYLAQRGRPVETFCRSAILGGSVTELTPRKADGNGEYPAEDCVRVVEFETPAAILCGTVTDAIPPTYRKAYFDLIATGFKPESPGGGVLRMLVRLVGTAAHLRKFKSLVIGLANVDKPARQIEVQLDNGEQDFTKAIQLRIETEGWSVVLLRSDGRTVPVKAKVVDDNPFTNPAASEIDPGLFMTIVAPDDAGEFWADASLLHASKELSGAFEFNWLFAEPGGHEPATEVAPRSLQQMVEVQARIVTVSPPIPIVSHNEVFPC